MGKMTELQVQVADVIIRRQSRRTRCGPWLQKRCCDCCFTKKFLDDYYFRLALLALIFLFILVGFLVFLVAPYLKTLHYQSARCSTTSVSHTAQYSCKCGKGCVGYFPCLVVHVRYTSTDGRHAGDGMLHDVEFGGECSFTPPCRRDEGTNRYAVSAWRDEIESGSFSCLYDPSVSESPYVMRAPRLGALSVANLILWPLLALVACIVMLVVMCRTCGWTYACTSEAPPDVAAAADSLLETGRPSLGAFSLEDREILVNDAQPNRR